MAHATRKRQRIQRCTVVPSIWMNRSATITTHGESQDAIYAFRYQDNYDSGAVGAVSFGNVASGPVAPVGRRKKLGPLHSGDAGKMRLREAQRPDEPLYARFK